MKTTDAADLFNDILGHNYYSQQLIADFNNGISNYTQSPSYRSVENMISLVRAAITLFQRNPELFNRKKSQENSTKRGNIFIIHGRDEAKWRELKEIIKSEFRLNPIILKEQPDSGCKTLIEKFEYYAQTCSPAVSEIVSVFSVELN